MKTTKSRRNTKASAPRRTIAEARAERAQLHEEIRVLTERLQRLDVEISAVKALLKMPYNEQ